MFLPGAYPPTDSRPQGAGLCKMCSLGGVPGWWCNCRQLGALSTSPSYYGHSAAYRNYRASYGTGLAAALNKHGGAITTTTCSMITYRHMRRSKSHYGPGQALRMPRRTFGVYDKEQSGDGGEAQVLQLDTADVSLCRHLNMAVRSEDRTMDRTLYSGDLEESVGKEKAGSPVTERMLHVTLKILHLLTGEDYAPLKHGSSPPMTEESVTPITGPSSPSLIHERTNDKKILDLIHHMIHLLSGEVRTFPEGCPQRCDIVPSERSSGERAIGERAIEVAQDGRNNMTGQNITTQCTQTKYSSTEGARRVTSISTQTEYTSTYILVCNTLKKQAPSNKKQSPAIVTSFKCSLCSWAFSSDSELLQHQSEHKEMACAACGRRFSCRSHLERHRKIHTGERMFLCSECGKCFALKSALLRHQMIHTGEKPFACSVCGRRFNQRSHYERHQLSHSGKKPFSCSECGKRFIQKCDLAKHRGAHKGEPLVCPVCGKRFCSKMFLIKHRSSHSKGNKAVCPDCGKCFTQKSALVVHQRIHTGEKPYSCSDCGKVFNRKSLLVRHQRIHTGEKPFSCPYCGKSFTRSTNLIIHRRTHTGETPFSCKECHKIFSSNATLIKHQKVHVVDKDVPRLEDVGQKKKVG